MFIRAVKYTSILMVCANKLHCSLFVFIYAARLSAKKIPIPLSPNLLCPKLQRDFLGRVQTTCLTVRPVLICQGGGEPSYHRISN